MPIPRFWDFSAPPRVLHWGRSRGTNDAGGGSGRARERGRAGAMTTRLADERAFAEVKRLCYAGLDSEALRRRAAEALRRAVPSEGYCITEADPASGIGVRLIEEPRDPEGARRMLQRVFFEGVWDEQRWMAANGV